jgi:hypothetical protein
MCYVLTHNKWQIGNVTDQHMNRTSFRSCYFLIYVIYMRKYCGHTHTQNGLEILTDLHVFRLPDYEAVVFGMPCMCMDVHLATT